METSRNETLVDDNDEEKRHYQRSISTFHSYYRQSLVTVVEKLKWYCRLSSRQQAMVPSYKLHLNRVESCLRHNQIVLKAIVHPAADMFANVVVEVVQDVASQLAPLCEVAKLHAVMRHFVRDWSADGQSERDACYGPVLVAANRLYPPERRSNTRVLVPGAGLGRLPWEFANAGYISEGNEASLYMLFCSNFVMNHCASANAFTLYPWVHQWTNHMAYDDQVAPVSIPNVDPNSIAESGRFSMAAGDFLDAYKEQRNCWDMVATVFFLDTAHNIIDYVEAIYRLLVPNGYWINMGPLLYHYSDIPGEPSIDLSYEELRSVIEQCGFCFIQEDRNMPATYTGSSRSMLSYTYRCIFFVCQKNA